MNSPETAPLPIGRISGFRGRGGEVTLRVASGAAARWTHLRRAVLSRFDETQDAAPRAVESARAYRDRLVLKFAGVDDASQAGALRGLEVSALPEDVPQLPDGVYWASRLVGATVTDVAEGLVGRVEDVLETGGVDLLVVRGPEGDEILVPLAGEIVRSIDEAAQRIEVALPAGLRDINSPDREPS